MTSPILSSREVLKAGSAFSTISKLSWDEQAEIAMAVA